MVSCSGPVGGDSWPCNSDPHCEQRHSVCREQSPEGPWMDVGLRPGPKSNVAQAREVGADAADYWMTIGGRMNSSQAGVRLLVWRWAVLPLAFTRVFWFQM